MWLRDEEKIRVVSVSAAPSGPKSPFTKNNQMWDDARARAEEAGILVLDCTGDRRFVGECHYGPGDREDVAQCKVEVRGHRYDKQLLAPTAPRTITQRYEEGSFSYEYDGEGGRAGQSRTVLAYLLWAGSYAPRSRPTKCAISFYNRLTQLKTGRR